MTFPGFQHEAMFYASEDEFLGGTLAFLRTGLENDEPALVALPEPRATLLQDALGADAHRVTFVNMLEIGRNPACIIPAWRDFVDRCGQDGQPIRGIGEPAWDGRSDAEFVECDSHESLLNLAFEDAEAFALLCPYDEGKLPQHVLDGARRNHPWITGEGHCHHYVPPAHAPGPFEREIAPATANGHELPFTLDELSTVRTFIGTAAQAAGLPPDRAADLVLAVNELVTNSVRHAGGAGRVKAWRENGYFVCEVNDGGRISNPLAGREHAPEDDPNGRGLWIVNHLCDLVQIRSRPGGSLIRLHMHLDA